MTLPDTAPAPAASDRLTRVMTWPVTTVDPSATLRQVAETLAADEVGAAVVLSNDHVVGIVSERDVVAHLAAGAHPDHVLVEEVVTYAPVTVEPRDTVRTAALRMVEARVRHLPVLDDGELAGMVSLRDVTAALLEELDARG